jgi:hypothetical protein
MPKSQCRPAGTRRTFANSREKNTTVRLFLLPYPWAFLYCLMLVVLRSNPKRRRSVTLLPCIAFFLTTIHYFGSTRTVEATITDIRMEAVTSLRGQITSYRPVIYIRLPDGQDDQVHCASAGGLVVNDNVLITFKTLLWTDVSDLCLATPDPKNALHNKAPRIL